jgi:UV DNA damage endonuclease
MIDHIGYACICTQLQKQKIGTNRSMVKKTFDKKGLDYVSELALLNSKDIIKILRWNVEHGIRMFRMSSAIVPWGDKIDITTLKDYPEMVDVLGEAGEYAHKESIRLSAHPGPFVVLTSPKAEVVKNAIADLELHGLIFDLMGLSRTPYNKINIHCNGVYGDKTSAMDRFADNFGKLSAGVRGRLTVENDDSPKQYSVKDLMYLHDRIGIPIVFDYFHHQFCTGGLTEEEALKLATSTWPEGITPVVHYSESKALHEGNSKIRKTAHSDYINRLPETYGLTVDVMLECKMKELALLKIRGQLDHISI